MIILLHIIITHDNNIDVSHCQHQLLGQLMSKKSFKTQSTEAASDNFADNVDTNFPILPPAQDRENREMVLAFLRKKTKDLKEHYFNFCRAFRDNFCDRERKGQVRFEKLKWSAFRLFEFDNSEKEQLLCSEYLLEAVFLQQSYVDFNLLMNLINECGTEEDLKAAQRYTESFEEYVKQRVFVNEDPKTGALSEYDEVMFVIDRDHKDFDVYEFRLHLSEMLEIDYIKIIVRKVKRGCITIVLLMPTKCIYALSTAPLYWDRVLTLKDWNTRSISFPTRDPIYLDHFNLLNEVTFIDSAAILKLKTVQVLPVDVDGEEYMAIQYLNDNFSAEVGYIEYIESFIYENFSNLPSVKGIYYPNLVEGSKQYPMIIVERLTALRDVFNQDTLSEVDQVSILIDLAVSVESFLNKAKEYDILVCPDAVFIRGTSHDVMARFCPLYSHSFAVKHTDFCAKKVHNMATVPLSDLEWMSDIVKFIHFEGRTTEQKLPEKHILKKIFDQKWLSNDKQFRPENFKVLLQEMQNLLGKNSCIIIATVKYPIISLGGNNENHVVSYLYQE